MKAVILLLILPFSLISQKTAFWETKFYFEDAVGNKDSITLGHDLESNGEFNPEFGEINIKDIPWNSDFEVRASHNEAAHNLATPTVLSKKIIGSTEGGLHPTYHCLFVREPLKLFVKIKKMPLTISWDSTLHEGFCNRKDFLTPHSLPLIFPNWFHDPEFVKDPPYVCLAEKSSYIVESFTRNNNGFVDYILDVENDGSIDSIYGLLISFRTLSSSNSPCNGTVDVKNLIYEELDVNLFPNPTAHSINVNSFDPLSWQLYDNQGKFIRQGNDTIIDINQINDGIYILRIRIKDRIIVKKIVKSS